MSSTYTLAGSNGRDARKAEEARKQAEAAEAARNAEEARKQAEAAEAARKAEKARKQAEAAEQARLLNGAGAVGLGYVPQLKHGCAPSSA